MAPVKLPKEVLNMFPMWEYRCPRCNTYAESNTAFCPKCKTAFDENKWQVPPRFLKNKEAMSEYAHKVLAPKLTPEQRKTLFKHFSEVFEDGLESGDFSNWTGISIGGGNTLEIVGSTTHHGGYAAHAIGQSGVWGANVRKTGFDIDEVYIRWYMLFANLPSSNGNNVRILSVSGAYSEVVRLFIQNSNGDQILTIQGYPWVQNGFHEYAFQMDTWYCFEYSFKKDMFTGWHKVWLAGEPVIDLTEIDTSSIGNFTEINALGVHISNGFDAEVYFDCVSVADTYIGPEAGGQTYAKTWITDVLFEMLGVTETFNIDAVFQKRHIGKDLGLDVGFKRLDSAFSFGVDACFGATVVETVTAGFVVDTVFAYKVGLPELWVDENGRVVLNVSSPYVWVGC